MVVSWQVDQVLRRRAPVQGSRENLCVTDAGTVAAPLEAAWDSIRLGLRRDCGARTFDGWLKPAELGSFEPDGGTLELGHHDRGSRGHRHRRAAHGRPRALPGRLRRRPRPVRGEGLPHRSPGRPERGHDPGLPRGRGGGHARPGHSLRTGWRRSSRRGAGRGIILPP